MVATMVVQTEPFLAVRMVGQTEGLLVVSKAVLSVALRAVEKGATMAVY